MVVWTHQLALVGGILAVGFAGPFIAIAFLLFRKRVQGAKRRSPIGIDLLRAPGHSLRTDIDKLETDMMFEMTILMVIPLLTASVFLAQAHLQGLDEMLRIAWVYGMCIAVVVGWSCWRLYKAATRLDRLRSGYDAEVAVGQELDQLMRRGAVVFHDIPGEGFNIDHVVIAPAGVFAVETKGYSKLNRRRGREDATVRFDGQKLKFPTWTTSKPLTQAASQARWLGQWLTKATGEPIRALPVLALPGWFVQLTGRGDVRVFNGKQLKDLLEARGAQPLTEAAIARVAHQVEQRCRTVTPLFNDSANALSAD